MRTLATTFAICLLASACTPKLQSTLPIGVTAIVPDTSPKLGHLYFAQVGHNPAFQLEDGTIYSEMCRDDFKKTNNLKAIDSEFKSILKAVSSSDTVDSDINDNYKYVSYDSDVFDSANVSQTFSTSISASNLTALTLSPSADGSYTKSYNISKAKQYSLTDDGVELIKKSIGKKCKNWINKFKKQKINTIIIVSAVRAKSITISNENTFNFEVGNGTVTPGAGVTRTNTITKSNTYLGANLDSMF